MRLLESAEEWGRLDLGRSLAEACFGELVGTDGEEGREGEGSEGTGEEGWRWSVVVAALVTGVSWMVEGAAGLEADCMLVVGDMTAGHVCVPKAAF